MITVHSIEGGTITEFRVVGATSFDEVCETIERTYPGMPPLVLWDISSGSMVKLETKQLMSIAKLVSELRPGGFTAYVGSVDVEYGLLRMYEGLSAVAGTRHESTVHRTRDQAIRWLKERADASQDSSP